MVQWLVLWPCEPMVQGVLAHFSSLASWLNICGVERAIKPMNISIIKVYLKYTELYIRREQIISTLLLEEVCLLAKDKKYYCTGKHMDILP